MLELGKIVATASFMEKLGENASTEIATAVQRHQLCDWGEVSDDDRKANDDAVSGGERVLSAYRSSEGTKFWVITEWDRSVTTLLLPGDY